MSEEYYVGTYWLARGESPQVCAQRAETFFHLLGSCSPLLSRWYKKGPTLEEALKHTFVPTRDELLIRFSQQKEGRSDDDFQLGVWNGEANQAASSISLHCGSASIRTANYCFLEPPEEGPAAEHLLQLPLLTQVLRAMAVAWEPEWGVATSREHRDAVSPSSAKAGTFVGWVTYFSHRRGPLPPLPSPVRLEPVENLGTLVILTPERLTASNPAHVSLALDVAKRLSQAGLLTPLRPWDERVVD